MKPALLFCGVAAVVAANGRSKNTVSHRRFFPVGEMLADELEMPRVPRDSKWLRGSTLDFPMSSATPLALPVTRMVVPLEGISDVPEIEDGVEVGPPEGSAEFSASPVAVDGPLRDLVDFGSAIGAAVLPRAVPGSPLELPMDILHVKMQQEVPKPLTVDDSPSKVHIYGALPKNLTAQTLQVSSEGRNLVVKYFIDQGKQAGNSVVGIDERFTLDFEPLVAPTVRYKASTGAFELTLPRPPKETSGQQVNIEFDDVAQPQVAVKKVAPRPVAPRPVASRPVAVPLHLEKVAAKPNAESTRKRVEEIADEFATHFSHVPTPKKESSPKAELHDVRSLAKMTKQLREAGQAQKPVFGRDDQAKRAEQIAAKAKRFVAEAKLGDANAELHDAFAPQIFEGEGMVLLELNHKAL